MKILLRFALFSLALGASVRCRADTVALWLFDEQPGIYPSSLLNDCGPNGYFLVLGRGGEIVPGKFGRALRVIPPPPFHPRVDGKVQDAPIPDGAADLIRFGLATPSLSPGRTVAPMTWYNATFAAAFVDGDRQLRRKPFANPSDSKLNLGAGDWTVEFWLKLDAGANGEGVIFELGSGPRGENNVVTRLSVDPDRGVFRWLNQPAGAPLELRTDAAALRRGAWAHCAFVHDGSKAELRHYFNGVLISRTATPRWSALPHGDEAYFSVGRDGTWGRPLPGALDELRFSDDAEYAANFTPPGSFSTINNGRYTRPRLLAGPPLLFPDNRAPAGVIDLGSRRFLFLDDALIARSEHITCTAHPARLAEQVIKRGNGWISVVDDGHGLIHLYTTGPDDIPLVYSSRDGIHFDAPDLGHGEIRGYRNFVTRDPATVGMVFIDPNGPAEQRWKLVSGLRDRGGIFVYTSADGWNFRRNETAALPFWPETATTVFYDDQRQTYVIHDRSAYYRDATGALVRKTVFTQTKDLMEPWPFHPLNSATIREVAQHQSTGYDLLNPWWLDNGPLAPGGISLEYPIAFAAGPPLDPVGVDVYNIHAVKYAWAPDAYLAFPLTFFHYKGAFPAARKQLAKKAEARGVGLLDTQLAVSRDGLHWERYPRPSYVDIGQTPNYPAMPYVGQGIVRRGNELWQYCYVRASYHSPVNKQKLPDSIYRLVQRVDGFVSADAPYTGGNFTTKPMRFTGSRLMLNIDTSATGYAQVGILDENGRPIPGFSVDDCVYISGNEINYGVEWLGKGRDVSALAGRTVELEFRMRNTSLYALQFIQK